MKKAIVIAVGLVFVASAALAGQNALLKLAIHVKSHPTSCTQNYPLFTSCGQIEFTYAGCGDVDVMPVFFDAVAFTSVEFGLTWSNFPSATMLWTRCKGDAGVGDIAHPGDGTVITWATCQPAYSVAPGYGWIAITGPEFVCPTVNPVTHRYGMTDCAPSPGPYFDYPIGGVSCAGICGMSGDDACRPDAAEPSTWGAIKAMIK
jgi:hypothetical protein